jgi:hypothetical protein
MNKTISLLQAVEPVVDYEERDHTTATPDNNQVVMIFFRHSLTDLSSEQGPYNNKSEFSRLFVPQQVSQVSVNQFNKESGICTIIISIL